MQSRRLSVVLGWHMHQPSYRPRPERPAAWPWTYLHALKDYADMAAHLEAIEGARAFVDFSPVLLEDLEELARAARGLDERPAISEPLLDALRAIPEAADARSALAERCRLTVVSRIQERFPHIPHEAHVAESHLRDLVMAVHLAWWGEVERRNNPVIGRLLAKGRGYDAADATALHHEVARLLCELPGRYRALSDAGKVELAMTPYAHPILPLLFSFDVARETLPGAPLPEARYPGGGARARWHLEHGLQVFERIFGVKPAGCWPSEGAIDTRTLALLDGFGFRWTASSGVVWRNSVNAPAGRPLQPVQVGDQRLRCFFRDDALANRIGFEFQKWHGDDAAANLVHELEQIAREHPGGVVTIILDGENAWEHYPDNAYHFLRAMYGKLAASPRLHLTTPSAVLNESPACDHVSRIAAGSWVYGTLSTWIGDADKNRAWQVLSSAKAAFDRRAANGSLGLTKIAEQLARCESSDWFWWLGANNSPDNAARFESLLREHMRYLYELIDHPVPHELDAPIGVGRLGADSGAMRGVGS